MLLQACPNIIFDQCQSQFYNDIPSRGNEVDDIPSDKLEFTYTFEQLIAPAGPFSLYLCLFVQTYSCQVASLRMIAMLLILRRGILSKIS